MIYYNREIETMPLPILRKLQNERLLQQVSTLYEKVPFYKKLFHENGLTPGDIKSINDLNKIPFTKKNALRDNYPFGLFARPMDEICRLHASSGTTGKPTVVGYTRHDIDIFAETIARSLVAGGCQPGMKLQNAYGYGLFTGGLGLHYGAEKLGMTVIPISGGNTDRQILLLQDFETEAICCTPSYALTIAEEIRNRNISLDSLKLKIAILGAEPWTESIRTEVEAGLMVTATNLYGLSEIMGPGVSQEDYEEKGTGSYVWEDHFFPEIVDKDSGEPLPDGQYGVLVFTTLTKQAMPLLRYWTNDITNIYYDKSAKRTHVKMGQIMGRSDDMLIIRGVNLFHTQVEAILNEIEDLSTNYQLHVSRHGAMDEVEVHVEISAALLKRLNASVLDDVTINDTDALRTIWYTLQKKIKDNIGLSMKVVLKMPGAIPRSEGGKLGRIVDLRKK